jgi:hypothetical protein
LAAIWTCFGAGPSLLEDGATFTAEPTTGLEPVTSSLPRKCSTTELGGRTRIDWRETVVSCFFYFVPLERETGFEPATFSLEG